MEHRLLLEPHLAWDSEIYDLRLAIYGSTNQPGTLSAGPVNNSDWTTSG